MPTLQGIIRGRIDPYSIINSDGWCGYNGLVDIGYGHYRVDHSRDEFVNGPTHMNGIEGFWGLAKVRLTKFKGVPKHTFHLHMKETEWRYNYSLEDKYKNPVTIPQRKTNQLGMTQTNYLGQLLKQFRHIATR